VPRFLLSNFAFSKERNPKIWAFDKKEGRIFQTSVKGIAAKNYFYDFEFEDGIIGTLEPSLARLESEGAKTLRALIKSRNIKSLNPRDSVALAVFSAAQLLRTPNIRENLVRFNELIVEKFGQNIRVGTEKLPPKEDWGKDAALASRKTIAQDSEYYARILLEKQWALYASPPGINFYISDNPIVMQNHKKSEFLSNLGIGCKGIEIHLPISSKLNFLMLCPETAIEIVENERHAESYGLPKLKNGYSNAFDTGMPVQLTPENMDNINSLQVIYSERFVYSKRKEDFVLAEKMLREHPEFRSGPRMSAN